MLWSGASAMLSMSLLLAGSAHAQTPWPDPARSPSEPMPKASRSLLLDALTLDGGRLVAVGERGHVLLSDDDGAQWRQVVVPTRATLTAVAASGRSVIAVGHDGVILRSDDAGDRWQRVREEPYSADNVASASNGSPLLDVLFLDDRRVLAVGAYSLILASDDGGATWRTAPMVLAEPEPAAGEAGAASDDTAAEDTAADDAATDDTGAQADDPMLFSDEDLMLDDEVDPHLNAIVRVGADGLLLAGERGTVFRSRDGGASWQRLALPYGGSMFGALAQDEARVIVFGLRGRAFVSDDFGDSWQPIDTGVRATLFDGIVGADGALALVGAEGTVLRRAAGADAFRVDVLTNEAGETPVSSAVLARADGSLLLFGERGVTAWQARP